MLDSNPHSMPANSDVKLVQNLEPFNDSHASWTHCTFFQSLIGTLQYAASATRPNIANRVCELAQYNQNPSQAHLTAALDVLQYLKKTVNYGLTFTPGEFNLTGYCDADFATSLDMCHSTSAYIFLLAGTAITWSSKSQSCVALSTTEAEYATLNHAAQEAVWLQSLLLELQLIPDELLLTLHTDNKCALSLAQNPVFHSCTKHIAVEAHWI